MGYGYLKKLEVKDKTAKFEIPAINAALIVRPATEANKPYFNQVLKRSRKRIRAAKQGVIDISALEESREEDRELFPQYVIVGWENMTDGSGNLVEYSIDEGRQFLSELPNWLFDDLRDFASNATNFVELMDVEDKSGN